MRTRRIALRWALLVVAVGTSAVAVLPASAAGGCQVAYTVSSQWPGGFGADVAVTNLGDPVNGSSGERSMPGVMGVPKKLVTTHRWSTSPSPGSPHDRRRFNGDRQSQPDPVVPATALLLLTRWAPRVRRRRD